MNEKIKKTNEKKRNLIEKINLAQRHKKEVIDKVNVLDAIYSQREITFGEYEERTKSIFGERSPKKWIEYYNYYIKGCQSEIERIDKSIKKENIKKISYFVVLLFLFFLLTFLFFEFSNRGITGSTVERFKESYTESIGKEFISNENYVFNVRQTGELNYLKISGEIEGEGNVKVYLQKNEKEFLILDSNELEFEKVILTGGTITGFGTEGVEDSGSSGDSFGSSGDGSGSTDGGSSSLRDNSET